MSTGVQYPVNIPQGRDGQPPILPGVLVRPKVVKLEGERLFWDFKTLVESPVPTGLLERFIDLHEHPERLLRFARSCGVLGLDWPDGESYSPKYHDEPWWYVDAVPRIMSASARLAALLRIIIRASEGKAAQPKDCELFALGPHDAPYRSVKRTRDFLQVAIADLLEAGKVTLAPRWNREAASWEIRFTANATPNLLGCLAIEVAAALGNSDGFALCSHCGKAYLPERRPNPNRAHYCFDCRESSIPQILAKRRHRAGLARPRGSNAAQKPAPL
jgi:hypothetical protein